MLFLVIFILTFICSYFLPWWMIAIIAFAAAAWLGKKPGRAFLVGFGAVFFAWIILALIKSLPNDNTLASRVSLLMQLPNWIVLLAVTGIVGGLVGGMSAISGALVKKAFGRK